MESAVPLTHPSRYDDATDLHLPVFWDAASAAIDTRWR
jgi:hypothetical protein